MRSFVLSISLILFSMVSFAQSELTMPLMENVFQSTYSNPAAIPAHKLSIGLPGLSSVYAGGTNTGFSFNDLVGKRANDTTFLDFDQALSRMKNKNYLYAGGSADLFSLRVKVRDYFFGISISEKASARFSYPKDLLKLLWNGTGEFVGSEASLKSFGVDAIHYREYAFHGAKQTRNWVFGGRVKYLTGLSNVNLKAKNLGLSVGKEMYELAFTSDVTLNTSGIPVDTAGNSTEFDPVDYFNNFKNSGFAIDGGVSYKYNSKLTLSFCVNNLGYIRWKDKVRNYNVRGGNEFSGFDAGKQYFQDSTENFEGYLDSLRNSFEYTESENKYTTWLLPHFYITAKYRLGKNTEAAGSLFFEKYKAIRPALTLALTQKVGRVLNVVLSYSVQYGKFNNVGLGLMVKPGPVQIYAVTDNVLSALNPSNAKFFNVRCGMNLVFGRIRGEDQQPYKSGK